MVDLDELKKDFLNEEFDSKEFQLDADKVVTAALASGETRPCFVDTDDPDFQATPAFLCSMASGRHLPIDFPKIGGLPMDGGKAVTCHAPVPCGETLTGKTHLHEIYDKKAVPADDIRCCPMELYIPTRPSAPWTQMVIGEPAS